MCDGIEWVNERINEWSSKLIYNYNGMSEYKILN